jgi:hypothetical protein
MQIFTNTPVQTTFRFADDFTVMQLLGCGIILIHSDFALLAAKNLGCKVRTLCGKRFGLSVFTKAV